MDRDRLERCLEPVAAYRASGLKASLGNACHAVLRMPALYAGLLNNLKDGTLYIVCISVKPEASMQAATALGACRAWGRARAGEISGIRRRCRLVVWLGHTHRQRLARHRNSPRRGPNPKPDRLLDSTHRKEWCSMGKRIATAAPAEVEVSFGERLASLRKAAGFTQIELAAELGVSPRMVAYYESPAATPPANLLPQIATALGVTIDEMFGHVAKRKLVKQEGDSRLRWRLLAIEKLAVAEKRQVLQVIDAFIERGQLKRKAETRA